MNKSIVVCYDGTSNEYGRNNTNVVKTFEAIVRDESQVAFYDPGVGTLSIFGRTIGRKVGVLLGLAFGYGIRQNIEDGYEYLMNKYQEGDSLYLFGFSRGAYTARALAGMIHEFGILHKDYRNLIPYVSKRYFKKKEKKDQEVIRRFKGTFSQDCVPYFIGIIQLNYLRQQSGLRLGVFVSRMPWTQYGGSPRILTLKLITGISLNLTVIQ